MLDALQVLCGVLVGGGTMYAVLTARGASEAAESSEACAKEAAEEAARLLARQEALDRRLWACERATDELCLRTALGVRRKGESSADPRQ